MRYLRLSLECIVPKVSTTGRDPAFLKFVVNFTLDVARARDVLAFFPPMLKPFVAKLVVNLDARVKEGMQIFGPLIEERRKIVKQLGKDSPERPVGTPF